MKARRLGVLIPLVATLATLAALVPSAAATTGTPGVIAAVDYAVGGAPSTGFTSISYPLTVLENDDAQASWLWAEEVTFAGDDTVARLGLQPAGADGKTAFFSVAGGDAAGEAQSCTAGDSSGVSCHIPYSWAVGATYTFTMSLVATSASTEQWQGTVTAPGSVTPTTIGEFTVAASRGLIQPTDGSIEYDGEVSDCSAIPQMSVRYDAPTAALDGASYPATVTDVRTPGSADGGTIACGSVAHVSLTASSATVAAPQAAMSNPTPTPPPNGPAPPAAPPPAPFAPPRPASAVPPVAAAPRCPRYTVTLSISVIVVPAGSSVLLTGVVTQGSKTVSGVPVSLTERYADGKIVPLGTSNTDATGTFAHHGRPLYNGTVTAGAGCATSPPVPSRVTVGFGALRVVVTGGGTVTVSTSTRPGFLTGPHRSEQVQLLETDRQGLRRQVIATTNSAQRSQPRGEPQGVNVIRFTGVSLPRGVHYLAVRVLGTPVNAGAVSRPVRVEER